MSIVGLIPGRSGSKRIKNKNIRLLAGHPLLSYAIASALESEVFDKVVVSTDSEKYAEIAQSYGAETILCQIPTAHQDTTPDIAWVSHALENLPPYDAFAILRPTSPFRTAQAIRTAWALLQSWGLDRSDSIRAVEKVKQHPAKTWVIRGGLLSPVLPYSHMGGTPWHSSQYPSLPEVYVQNASLEVAWASTVPTTGTISGERIMPFFTEGNEGFDINTEYDFDIAEMMVRQGDAELPKVKTVVKAVVA